LLFFACVSWTNRAVINEGGPAFQFFSFQRFSISEECLDTTPFFFPGSQLSTINFCHPAAINIIRRASILFATLNR